MLACEGPRGTWNRPWGREAAVLLLGGPHSHLDTWESDPRLALRGTGGTLHTPVERENVRINSGLFIRQASGHVVFSYPVCRVAEGKGLLPSRPPPLASTQHAPDTPQRELHSRLQGGSWPWLAPADVVGGAASPGSPLV